MFSCSIREVLANAAPGGYTPPLNKYLINNSIPLNSKLLTYLFGNFSVSVITVTAAKVRATQVAPYPGFLPFTLATTVASVGDLYSSVPSASFSFHP